MKRLAAFLVGISLGIGLAMLIGWVLFPLERQEITPASMRADYQAEYVRLIARSYQATGDLSQAKRRLSALSTDPITAPLVELTERWITEGRSRDLIAPLAQLACDLEANTATMAPYLEQGAE